MRGGRCLWTCVVMLAACRDLPELSHGVCGNGVVESGEDCDGLADPEHACGGAAEATACRYTCAAATCPAGWGCSDGLCRYGTGELVADPPVPLAHDSLAIADIDGDRRGDIIAISTRGVHVMF